MTAPDLIGLFIEPLEDLDIAYMITGGVASVIYGDPRFTRDVDIVVELSPRQGRSLLKAFRSDDFYTPPLEVLTDESTRPGGGHFNIIHRDTALRADVYVAGSDPLHAWGFQHRRRLQVDRIEIWVAPVEYVIVRKLQYYAASDSDRHLRDVAMMLRISDELVDNSELERWVAALDLHDALDRARAYVTR